jgi:hypothetical protein
MSIQATSEMIAAFNEAFRAVRNDSVTYEDALKLGIEAALSAAPQPELGPAGSADRYFFECGVEQGKKWIQQDYIDLHNKHEALKAEGIAIGSLSREAGSERIVLDPIGDPHIKDGMIVYTAPDALKAEVERLKQFETALNEWMDKSEWITPLIKPRHLGKHRADVMRELYEEAKQEQQP